MPEHHCQNQIAPYRPLTAAVLALSFVCLFADPVTSCAQLSFGTAINRALDNSARIRTAQLDLRKAQQNLALAKDIFIPSVVVGGGLGWSYGITLTVPTIFTVNAQSLIYSNQQRFLIRAAHADLEAARFSLLEARQRTEEDAAITFISLEEKQAAIAALSQQYEFAAKLVAILEDRVHAGLDSELDLDKTRRGALQIQLQQMLAEDEEASERSELSKLTGLSTSQISLAAAPSAEIPDVQLLAPSAGQDGILSPGIRAREAAARGKLERARGDAGYTWRPTISFNAEYGRISPVNNVSTFYNLNGNYNTALVGVEFAFPILDRVRSAAARVSSADAALSSIDEADQQAEALKGGLKLQRSIRISATRAQIAELDYTIAQDELKSTHIRVHALDGSPPLTPKDEQNAEIQERQKYLDLLDARLELNKAKISLLRQTGQLDSWIRSLPSSSPGP